MDTEEGSNERDINIQIRDLEIELRNMQDFLGRTTNPGAVQHILTLIDTLERSLTRLRTQIDSGSIEMK